MLHSLHHFNSQREWTLFNKIRSFFNQISYIMYEKHDVIYFPITSKKYDIIDRSIIGGKHDTIGCPITRGNVIVAHPKLKIT